MTEVMHGKDVLSVKSGILVQSLVSMCNCSIEKLPAIQATLIQLNFGLIPQECREQLVRSSSTYDRAKRMSMDIFASQGIRALFDYGASSADPPPDGVVHASICMDASKKVKHLVVKLVTYSSVDKVTRMRALQTDLSHSKKAYLSSELTYDSLMEELGQSMIRILAGVGDNFGLPEIKSVLQQLDKLRCRLSQEDQALLDVEGTVRGQIYKYCMGWFAVGRYISCMMHAYERIMLPLLARTMGPQGLKNTATVAQALYSVYYYTKLNKPVFDAFNLASVGGDPVRLSELPKAITTQFAQVALTSSPLQRICVQLTAAFYKRHLQSASFFDGKSLIDPHVRTISTRAIEIMPHIRMVLQWLVALDADWAATMPEVFEFVQKEKIRAVRLGFVDDGMVLEEAIADIMAEATPDMLTMGIKYMHAPWMTVVWSLLHVTDPTLATSFAQGLLLALAANNSIELSEQQKQAWRQPVEVPDAAHKVS
ncbi:hypothetical protein B484DRAFT_481931 [Ochromonadaceae sp. CCMP2298]|nr:hypothetical protein B484DRAFT_481931 [Ochromonadaceae sp. CCMP2298]